MDKININPDFTLEEQLIIIVDKYISKRYHPRDKSFSYQLYLIFVGYHLKYFYPERIYSKSNRNIDNIMAMFSSVYKSLTSNLLQRLNNKQGVLRELNSLVNYWICPYISRHLLSLNPLQARCRRYSRGER